MKPNISLLIISQSPDQVQMIQRCVEHGYHIHEQQTINHFDQIQGALTTDWDVILADYKDSSQLSRSILAHIRLLQIDIPLITVTDKGSEDSAVDAMSNGAQDYILEDNLKRLLPAIGRELTERQSRQARRIADETIRHQAYHDGLTGLPNRILLFDRLQQALLTARRNQQNVSLLFMDLNKFKEINDTMGHHTGDVLLQKVAKRLQSLLRQTDTVARMGGDEFSIVLPDTGQEQVTGTCEKILNALSSPFQLNNKQVVIGVSIGIVFSPLHGDSVDVLMQKADMAMYFAKKRNLGIAYYSDDLERQSLNQVALSSELKSAIENEELLLDFQPKVDFMTGQLIGAEALMRWQHPEHGLLMPEHFIPLAEQSDLICHLTTWLIKQSLRQCKEWRQNGYDIQLSINISARNLVDYSLRELLQQNLSKYNIPADRLELELTESTMMADPTTAMKLMNQLTQMGVQFAIDDFGTGYSSLSYLKRLPVKCLKIDKSFTLEMTTDDHDAVIIRAAIDMAHNLGMTVVAEGVEDQSTWNLLQILRCDMAQGFHISRPVAANDTLEQFRSIEKHPERFSEFFPKKPSH